jgi:TATA-box binding protein (TBP) (component of TFIID and TFIIIB)
MSVHVILIQDTQPPGNQQEFTRSGGFGTKGINDSERRMIQVVNIVGSGALDVELALEQLADDIDEPVARYDPDKYPGM